MSKFRPVSVSETTYEAIKAYAETNDLSISAAADSIAQRGLMGLPAQVPATPPTAEGEAQQAPQWDATSSANLSRF